MSILLLGGFLAAFVSGLAITPLVARMARKMDWWDVPDGGRKTHTKPTPRAGGLAILVAFALGILYFFVLRDQFIREPGFLSQIPSLPLLLGSLAIVLTGLYDDAFGLGFKRKFVIQFVIAYMMFLAGFRFDISNLSFLTSDPYLYAPASLILTLLWYVGVMNAVNLIDGLDGLAGGISIIAFFSLTLISGLQGDFGSLFILLAITGAISSFLVYNFNPASIFLGDSGSLFIGFMLATYALKGISYEEPIMALLIISLAVGFPILDTVVAYFRRVAEGRSPFSADRDHIHHRLLERLGTSTRKAVLLLYLLNGLLGGIAIMLVVVKDVEFRFVILMMTGLLLGAILWLLGYMKMQPDLESLTLEMEKRSSNLKHNGNSPPFHKGLPGRGVASRQLTKAEILEKMSHLNEEALIILWIKINEQQNLDSTSQTHEIAIEMENENWSNEALTLEEV